MDAVKFSKALVLVLLLLAAVALAQKPAAPKYDTATETTLKGVVDEVKEVPNSCLGVTGLHLMIKTTDSTVEVQVGPVDFLKEIEVTFAKGDELQIVASKVTKDGNALLLAREVTQKGNVLVMRDKKGEPVWTWMKKS
ncbi:MAG: hypothetical protein ACE14L_13105 [Terriglobales bacterium]